MKSFDDLISETEHWELKGWDFYSLGDRWVDSQPPWDYKNEVRACLRTSHSILDMGTGGGEFLSSLEPLPGNTFATEGYLPNVPIAREKLEPLGVDVVRTFCEDNVKVPQLGCFPFRTACFDLVMNRHESFVASEVFRVLKPGGVFITQQVGSDDLAQLSERLCAKEQEVGEWNLQAAAKQLGDAGFRIDDKREANLSTTFKDIGAVVCCLKVTPYLIPDFSVEKYSRKLRELDEFMRESGGLEVRSTRFFLRAKKSFNWIK